MLFWSQLWKNVTSIKLEVSLRNVSQCCKSRTEPRPSATLEKFGEDQSSCFRYPRGEMGRGRLIPILCSSTRTVKHNWDKTNEPRRSSLSGPMLQCTEQQRHGTASVQQEQLATGAVSSKYFEQCLLALHFTLGVAREMYCDDHRLCVCVSVCLSLAAYLHYCMGPDVTLGNGKGCPLVVQYWADLQSLHGFRCYGIIRA